MTQTATEFASALKQRLSTVVFGMDEVIHGIILALLAKGHVLLEGPPGLGKTLLARTLSGLLDGEFKRVQCTADMMPSDLTGIHVYNFESKKFELMQGPLFSNVVLIDEINRTGPKTQSALLQSMEEGKITLDRNTYHLPEDFWVIASQNPREYEGTYPLLESQLDRFLVKLEVLYPNREVEKQILKTYAHPGAGHEAMKVSLPALPAELLNQARQQADQVYVSESLYDYVADIALESRSNAWLSLGLSSRGGLALMRCAKAEAAIRGSAFVTPDDIKTVAKLVVSHRLILTPEALLEGKNADSIFEQIISQVDVPRDPQVIEQNTV